jgi:hypothetical protein
MNQKTSQYYNHEIKNTEKCSPVMLHKVWSLVGFVFHFLFFLLFIAIFACCFFCFLFFFNAYQINYSEEMEMSPYDLPNI